MITAAVRHADFPQFWQSHKKKTPATVKLQNSVGFGGQTVSLNQQLHGRAINCNVTEVCVPDASTNKINASL